MKNEKKFLLATIAILVLAISSFTLFQNEEVTAPESLTLESAYVNDPSDFQCAGLNVGYVDLDSSDLDKDTEKEAIEQEQTEKSERKQRNFRIDLDDISKLIIAFKR
ncbi:MAG: hypothetical protein KJ941_01465 [Bacteroidetes bacterium]|nr:hypothetical protein [Bacteroidota bacterium]